MPTWQITQKNKKTGEDKYQGDENVSWTEEKESQKKRKMSVINEGQEGVPESPTEGAKLPSRSYNNNKRQKKSTHQGKFKFMKTTGIKLPACWTKWESRSVEKPGIPEDGLEDIRHLFPKESDGSIRDPILVMTNPMNSTVPNTRACEDVLK